MQAIKVFTVVSVAVLSAFGQDFVPVDAKMRRVETITDLSGKTTIVREEHGRFTRSSAGSLFSIAFPFVNGLEFLEKGKAIHTDATTGKTFSITYASAEARLVQTRKLPLQPTKVTQKFTGAKTIDGVKYFRRVVDCVDPKAGPQRQPCGEAWYSPENDFTLSVSMENRLTDGRVSRVLRECYGVQFGVEPDPKIFQIPVGFGIVEADSHAGH